MRIVYEARCWHRNIFREKEGSMRIVYDGDEKKFLDKVVNTFGKDNQLKVMQEEMAECVAAISHYLRGRDFAFMEMTEEMADVFVMLSQFYLMYESEIHFHLERKMNRLRERLVVFEKEQQKAGV